MPGGEEQGPIEHLEDLSIAFPSNLDLGAFYARGLCHVDLLRTLRVHLWLDHKQAGHVVCSIVVPVAGAHTVIAQKGTLIARQTVHPLELAGTLELPSRRAIVGLKRRYPTFHERRDRAVSDAAHGDLNAEVTIIIIVEQNLGQCIVWSDDWYKATVGI